MSKLLFAFACFLMMTGTALAFGDDDGYGNSNRYNTYNNDASPSYSTPGYRPQYNDNTTYAAPGYGTPTYQQEYNNYNSYSSPGYSTPTYQQQYNNYSSPGYSNPSYQRNYDDRQSGNAGWPTLGNTGGRPSQQRSGGSMLR